MNNPTQSAYAPYVSGLLERPRYFPRQLITPHEMTLEQTYFRDKLRRHNRLLHGWGVVCGAQVCVVPKAATSGTELWKVRIKPGYLLGPYGDEIVIETERTVDLRTSGVVSRSGDPAGELVDPWCSSVLVKRLPDQVYVAVKYHEVLTRPVRVQPVGCGCDDTSCEYSRWCDGYEIGILTTCPDSHMPPKELPKFDDLSKGILTDCPACPTDPWVVLAVVQLDKDGTIQKIDNCSCRRMVLSFSQFWWQCAGGAMTITTVQPSTLEPGKTTDMTIEGTGFRDGATVNLGDDVTVSNLSVKETQLSLTVLVAETAAPGTRMMMITNKDCSVATYVITITSGATPAPSQPGRATRRDRG
jgi:hypothetical protein